MIRTHQAGLLFLMLIMIHGFIEASPTKAFQKYWEAFDSYEEARVERKKNEVMTRWLNLKEKYSSDKIRYNNNYIADLKENAQQYQKLREQFRQQPNYPNISLNLAFLYYNIAMGYNPKKKAIDESYLTKAISVLNEITSPKSKFEELDKALYLKSIILGHLGQVSKSKSSWRNLAHNSIRSMYTAYANIALGDMLFESENPQLAIKKYMKALKIIKSLNNLSNKDYEILRVQYRIAWSSYRSADLKTCISFALKILQPQRQALKISTKHRIESDMIELLGDALFEVNDLPYTKSTLKRKILKSYSSKISLRVMERYFENESYRDVTDIGEFATSKFVKSLESPQILSIIAKAYKFINSEDGYLASLERLAILIPHNSLWRRTHGLNTHAISAMERISKDALIKIAAHYYTKSISTSSATGFKTAASYYKMLEKIEQDATKKSMWILKQANSHYFSGHIGQAKRQYSRLISDSHLSKEQLKTTLYQLVLCDEHILNQELIKILEKNKKISKDPILTQLIKNFEDGVNTFGNRFPNSNKSIDLLQKIAIAFRDLNMFEKSDQYWNRILLSNTSINQRDLAIRGIVYSKIRSSSPREQLEIISSFLVMENWTRSRRILRNELRATLTQAVRDASDKLSSSGQPLAAANLIISICEKVKNFPQRDQLIRDSSYLYAIGSDWKSALKLANRYLSSKDYKYKGDLSYLKARSQEYLLDFNSSARSYLAMAKNYPQHRRSKVALRRSFTLSLSERNYDTAIDAKILLAKRTKSKFSKSQLYQEAAQLYANQNMLDKAYDTILLALKNANSPESNLTVRLERARLNYQIGRVSQSLKELKKISKEARLVKDKIGISNFEKIYGESNFLLASEKKIIFDQMNIDQDLKHTVESIHDKIQVFDEIQSRLYMSIRSQSPQWASKSRYTIAIAAESLRDQIRNFIASNKIPKTMETKLIGIAKRFNIIAQKMFSQNLIARAKRPDQYKDNPWIKKSAIRVSGFKIPNLSIENHEYLPYTLSEVIPREWSL